jgi:hypothetical protein
MTLPAAVQKKVARAVELTTAAAAERLAAETPPAKPAASAQAPASGTPATTPEQQLKDAQAKVQQLTESLAKAEQQNRVLKGKYDTEVPRLTVELKTTQETVKELERKAAPVKPGTVRSVTDAERTSFGEDLIALIAKSATEIAEDKIREHLKPYDERINVLSSQTEAQFFATLDALCPGWVEQNDLAEFNLWLNGEDPGTGRSRMDRIKRAEALKQGHLVAEIFNAFREKREIGARAPKPETGPESQLTPASDGGNAPPPVEEETGKIYTRAEVTQFYRDKREGKYRGKEGEAKARVIELDLAAASREGRIR